MECEKLQNQIWRFVSFRCRSLMTLCPSQVTTSCLELPNFSPTITGVLWDTWHADRGVFVAYDSDKVYTYAFHKTTVYGRRTVVSHTFLWAEDSADVVSRSFCLHSGPRVVLVGSAALLFSQKPLLLYNGELTCQTTSGRTSELALSTHAFLKRPAGSAADPEELRKQLAHALQLKRSK